MQFAFDFFKQWKLVFEERFDSAKLDSEKWMTKSHWADKALGQNFSQIGDLHAFTDGKNVLVGAFTSRCFQVQNFNLLVLSVLMDVCH